LCPRAGFNVDPDPALEDMDLDSVGHDGAFLQKICKAESSLISVSFLTISSYLQASVLFQRKKELCKMRTF
jgi:hypothetical protein